MAGLWFRLFRVNRIEDKPLIKELHLSPSDQQKLQILQRQDVTDASLGEWGGILMKNIYYFLRVDHDNDVDEDVDEQPVQDLAPQCDNVFKLMM
ncbi:hypothetical protein Tco_0438199 [Tanacetum coccineum]